MKKRRRPLADAYRSFRWAKDNVLEATLNAVAEEAIRRGMTRVELNVYSDTYSIGDRKVKSARIDKIVARYCTEIHPQGVLGIWTPEKGWQ